MEALDMKKQPGPGCRHQCPLLSVQGKEMMVLDRSESYIGVLIDDLVRKS